VEIHQSLWGTVESLSIRSLSLLSGVAINRQAVGISRAGMEPTGSKVREAVGPGFGAEEVVEAESTRPVAVEDHRS
jgi:hypothetical protein